MKRRNAAMLLAPASPADTAVVVPWNGTSSSAGMPIAEPYGKCVRVQVDQSRRHQPPGRVEHAQRTLGRNVGFDRLDHAVANADVANAARL